jgi:hypothetical protein
VSGPPEKEKQRSQVSARTGVLSDKNAQSRTDDSVGVQQGGIKLACPDALTDANLG